VVALATAFVRLRPQPDKAGFTKAGTQMGEEAGGAAGKSFGSGFTRGSDGKLRDSRGKFVKDSSAAGGNAGGAAGGSFATGFSKKTSKIGEGLKSNLKLAAGVFVPLGLAGAVGEIAKIGIAYQDNLNIFKVVSKATGAQMDTVAQKARQLGADVQLPGVSAAGAAEAMTELAKAGFTVQQSMDAARATLQLSRIANISEGQAAEIAANAVNAFGIKAKDTGKVVDELAAAANTSSIEITEASDSFKQAAATFSGFQGPAVGSQEAITELNTAIAILGNNGIKGSDAGTSLKQMLLQLTGPTQQAKDTMKELAINAAGANTSLGDQTKVLSGSKSVREATIKAQLKENKGLTDVGDIAFTAGGKMRSLRDILKLTAEGTKNMTDEQKDLAITQVFGADASRSVIALLKGGIPVYDKQRKAILQQGAAAQFAAAKNAGLGGAIDNVKSQLENAAIDIFNAVKGPLTQALTSVAGALPGIFQKIGAFAGFVHDNIGVIRDWALAIGAVTLALKINSAMLAITAAGGIIEFIKGGQLITGITKSWAAAQELLNITLVANPIGIVIVALTALVAGIILAYRHSETFRAIVQATWAGIKVAVGAVVGWFTGTVWPALQAVWNGIATGALWLWHNVIDPAWHGIQTVIGVVVGIVKGYIGLLVAEFHIIEGVALFLWHNVFVPVFDGIKKAAQIWWLATQIVFKLFQIVIGKTVIPVINGLRALWNIVFGLMKAAVQGWWSLVRGTFELFRKYILGPFVAFIVGWKNLIVGVFHSISATVSDWYNAHIKKYVDAARLLWTAFGIALSNTWNKTIKPLFSNFVGYIKNYVVGNFRTAIDVIKGIWKGLEAAAKVPVAFVVNHVINPFINGLNTAASIVGVKGRVAPIKGFRDGGQVGFASGGKISGAGGISDNRQAVIPGVGAVQLQGGEYIVDRQNTAKVLPLLRWISAGMKGGAATAARYIGRPLADMPGDGSDGWAFKSGGLVGWAENVWDSVTHPIDTIKKPFDAALRQVPGAGFFKDFLLGAANSLVDGSIDWIKKIAGGGGKVGDATRFLHQQDGKPYIWASAGPDGYDCSGIVSAVYNILHGRSPYSHTFSTESAGSFFPKPGQNGPMAAAWSHPGQAPAGATVGHMMGRVGNMNFESTGSRGVHLGKTTRSLTDFAQIGHYREGGLFDSKVRLFDQGGFWPSGTLGANMSGHTEYVRPGGAGVGETHVHFHLHDSVIGSQSETDRWLEKGVKRLRKERKLP
jgi:TP901 family phage tail tape measure protein